MKSLKKEMLQHKRVLGTLGLMSISEGMWTKQDVKSQPFPKVLVEAGKVTSSVLMWLFFACIGKHDFPTHGSRPTSSVVISELLHL